MQKELHEAKMRAAKEEKLVKAAKEKVTNADYDANLHPARKSHPNPN